MPNERRTKMHAQSYLLWTGPGWADYAITLCGRRTPRDRATKANEAVTCRACRQVVDREAAARQNDAADRCTR